jgi:DNA replication protein DnaC
MVASDVLSAVMAEGEAFTGACAVHGTYAGRTVRVRGRPVQSACPECFRVELQQEAQRDAAAILAHNAALQRPAFQMPRRYAESSFDNYERGEPEQARAFESCLAYAQDWEAVRHNGRCLILAGAPGNGKTHLAIAIGKVAAGAGAAVLFTTVADMAADIYSTYGTGDSEAQAVGRYSRADLLILDELGVQSGSDHEAVLLGRVLNYRYNELLPTVITTNLAPDEIRACLTDRLYDRLRERGGKMARFKSKSMRGAKAADER